MANSFRSLGAKVSRAILPPKLHENLTKRVVDPASRAVGGLLGAPLDRARFFKDLIKGIPSRPPFIMVGIIYNCNYHCFFCSIHSYLKPKGQEGLAHESAYELKFLTDKNNLIMPLAMYKNLVDDMARLRVAVVNLSGLGEPLLHPDLMEMIRYTSQKGISCQITTNGSLLTRDKVDQFLDAGLGSMVISINSLDPETYRETHGLKDDRSFNRLMDSIAYLGEKKKSYPGFGLAASFAISKLNKDQIATYRRFTREHNFSAVDFKPAMCPDYSAHYGLDQEEVDQVAAHMPNDGPGIHPIFKEIWLHAYHSQTVDSPCYAGFSTCFINSNGDVFPCCGCRLLMGSLRKQRFYDIWTSGRYMKFRHSALTYYQDQNYPASCDCAKCFHPPSEKKELGWANSVVESYLDLRRSLGRKDKAA